MLVNLTPDNFLPNTYVIAEITLFKKQRDVRQRAWQWTSTCVGKCLVIVTSWLRQINYYKYVNL
jgi:hypothetical protein